jgi:hypothetical protein
MSSIEKRLEHVKQAAEERSQIQRLCFDKLDLDSVKKPVDIGKLRLDYDTCIKENKSSFKTIVARDLALNPEKF